MKIAVINVDCIAGGSTGRIAAEIAKEQALNNDEILFAYGRAYKDDSRIQSYKISKRTTLLHHVLITRLFDLHGFGSYFATKKLINKLDDFNPDILWIHNIHGYYINIKVLFDWLKQRPDMRIYWLLHDCWAFTGHCAHFTVANCNRWQDGCFKCPQKKEYPASILIDNSRINYRLKKKIFTGLMNLTIITPSKWLADLVKKSFLKDYPVMVRHNKVDLSVFVPIKSDIRTKYGIGDQFVVLGVANKWTKRKGFDDFIELRKRLSDRFTIVLVGLTQQQILDLPSGIIGIRRTESTEELAKLYSASNAFFNPTYEDNFPTVNLEAEACGVPVITYNTGGCSETIGSKKSKVINVGDIDSAVKEIKCLSQKMWNEE